MQSAATFFKFIHFIAKFPAWAAFRGYIGHTLIVAGGTGEVQRLAGSPPGSSRHLKAK
jgi:hypothetical protein